MKRGFKILIFLGLLALSVFAAWWYYENYMKKPSVPDDNNSDDSVPPPDPNTLIGKIAVSKIDGLEMLDINGQNAVKTINEGADAGKITGIKTIPNQGDYFIIDELYLVGIGSVITR